MIGPESQAVALAAKYGDPKELLKESWIPAISGITAPVNYMNDFANDPASYIKAHEPA